MEVGKNLLHYSECSSLCVTKSVVSRTINVLLQVGRILNVLLKANRSCKKILQISLF